MTDPRAALDVRIRAMDDEESEHRNAAETLRIRREALEKMPELVDSLMRSIDADINEADEITNVLHNTAGLHAQASDMSRAGMLLMEAQKIVDDVCEQLRHKDDA